MSKVTTSKLVKHITSGPKKTEQEDLHTINLKVCILWPLHPKCNLIREKNTPRLDDNSILPKLISPFGTTKLAYITPYLKISK